MIDIQNPELLRYVRSELRPARVAVIMTGTVVVSLLLAMFISVNTTAEQLYTRQYWQDLYGAIVVASSIILVLWSLLNTSQAVVSERTQRTFDFWRTTRLSPMTLAIGKLFGAPIGAWLQFVTALPVAVFTGLAGGHHFTTIIGTFLIVALCNVTLSALALCLSMRSQDSRRATMLMLILAVGLIPGLSSMRMFVGRGNDVTLNAWTALNPIAALAGWHEGTTVWVSLFGHAAPSLLVTMALGLVVIAWCLTALVRSIKLEPDQSSLFSPLQVVGISTCFYLFDYAAFQPEGLRIIVNGSEQSGTGHATFVLLMATGVVATMMCLYFTVVATLHTRDRLRQELRVRQPREIAWRTVAPWLATGAIGLVFAIVALAKYRGYFADEPLRWTGVVAMYLAIAAYAVRDGMFLQWMIAQRVKAPVLKGSVLLGLYYVGSGVVSAVVAGPRNMWQMLRWLTPFTGDATQPPAEPAWFLLMLLIPPIATAVLLALGIFRKMQRMGEPVPSAARA